MENLKKALRKAEHPYYEDTTNNRILLFGGSSLFSQEAIVGHILNDSLDPKIHKTLESPETKAYERVTGDSISIDIDPTSLFKRLEDLERSQTSSSMVALFNSLRKDVEASERYHKAASQYGEERVRSRCEEEFRFFKNHMKFMIEVYRISVMLQEHKNSQVWGVGRGSACASFVLYTMGIHDIDPIEYDIPFIEFSKEREHDD